MSIAAITTWPQALVAVTALIVFAVVVCSFLRRL